MHATTRSFESPVQSCSVRVFGTIADDCLLRRVRGEFSEMPGMRLTLEQAARLWTIERATCARLLGKLIAARFLEMDSKGRYRKAHGGY